MTDDELKQSKQQLRQFLTMFSDCTTKNTEGSGEAHRFVYKGGSADLLVQHGRFYTPQPIPAGTMMGQMKQCFYNAATAALHDGYRYIEGYAAGIIPVHHAWCADKDNNVIEVTWKKTGDLYFGVEFDPKLVMNYRDMVAESVLFNHRHRKIYTEPFVEMPI